MSPERKRNGKKGQKTKPRPVTTEPMSEDCSRYSVTRDGRLLDSLPMEAGKPPLVFDKGAWIPFDGTVGQQADSIPVSAEEAAQFCKDGVLPDWVTKAIADDTGNYPDPWDD
jgi:hypothetical protein